MDRTRERRSEHWQVSPRSPDGGRLREGPHLGPIRITPIRVILVVALIGSLAYIAFALTVRDTSQIPMLSSGAAVLGLVFSALAIAGAISMWRAGVDRRSGLSFGMAALGGVSAMIALGCFAFAIVLALLWSA